jgi:hypothetical protein
MSPQFSAKPGRRERHLKRKFRNPLFPEEARQIDQSEVNLARQEDDQELQDFSQAFQEILKTIAELPANVESQVILDIKDRIDRMVEQVWGLGGDRSGERDGLTRLHHAIGQAIRDGAANDPEALARLEEEAQARELHWQLLQTPVVADLLYPQTPILPEDLIPTLLSQDTEDFAAAMNLFDDNQRQFVLAQAHQLLDGRDDDGTLDNARERIRQMEQLAAELSQTPSAH